ncbi:hypothetical protein LCGC14_1762700 [marine sediment metagenome]|uniref:Uncharacterized protein n=1 Tax=marine sediment metagenome TaxID=412755 RepID=A0A0F9H0M1_9ZZZZ
MSTIPSEVHKSEIATITDKVAIFRQEAEAIAVINQDDYTKALTFVRGVRAYMKDVGFKLDPGINSAKEHLEFLREEKAKHIRPMVVIDKAVSARAAAWREQERRAAAAEEERVNAERRRVAAEEAERNRIAAERKAEADRKERQKEIEKARKAGEFGKRDANRLAKEAEAQAERDRQAAREAEERARQVKAVKVKPAIPKMAGIKGRTNWKFRIVSPLVIPHAFLMPDEVRIGAHVRSVKNKELAESDIPGIEVWSEDSV